MTTNARRPSVAVLMALATAASASLTACGGNPEQPDLGEDLADVRGPEDLADPYDGPYDADFHTDVEAYADQEVTLSAAVDQVVSPVAFTITGPDGEEVEPLLVVSTEPITGLEPGDDLLVAATPHRELDIPELESVLGSALEDELYEEWEGEPYLTATIVRPAA